MFQQNLMNNLSRAKLKVNLGNFYKPVNLLLMRYYLVREFFFPA